MEEKYQRRLLEIDKRIEDLENHITMWLKAGGRGSRMAGDARQEIANLKLEKERILDGTQEKIDKIEEKIAELKVLKSQCKALQILKKAKINKEINYYEVQEAQTLKR